MCYVKFVVLFLLCKNVLSANILLISPLPSPSHHIWNQALALGLVEKGHNVTIIGPDEDKIQRKNYSRILLEGLYDGLHDDFNILELGSLSGYEMMKIFYEVGVVFRDRAFESKGFRSLLDYPPEFKFDLILYDLTIGYSLHPIITRFNNPPCIGVTPFLLPSYVSYDFGNSLHPSYLPWYNLQYGQDMSFTERVWNFILTYLDIATRNIWYMDENDEKIKEIFGEHQQTWVDVKNHISLVLANTDPILDYPQPLPPNIIPVGGLHTRPSKELPQDLKTTMNNAKNGVILFSLGTNVRSDKLGEIRIKALLKAFSQLKETVIWKFESDLPNLPKNVIIKKWLPQNDLLGHPNVKLFIGHGGALSTQEAIFHGVPMICIPFMSDQFSNSKMISSRKLGIQVDHASITSNYILGKIREILDNPSYREDMLKTSNRFRDRLETPLERGVFWVEYVLRHGDAHFLETKAKLIPFYKSSGADIISFAVGLALVFLAIIYKLLGKLFSFVCRKQKIKTH